MIKKLKFTPVSQPSGDETTAYLVEFPQGATVEEFVDIVLVNHHTDHGNIGLVHEGIRTATSMTGGSPQRNYIRGTMTKPFPDTFLNRKITKISARGGWTRMDYVVWLEREEE